MSAPHTKAGSSRVLVVDDDLEVLRFCERVLDAGGYRVVCATDAAEAITRLADGPYSALLIDIALPGQSGVHLLREMRMRGVVAPVVLMTAFPSLETAVTGMENGAIGYLIKPFDAQQLARALVRGEQLRDVGVLQARSPEHPRTVRTLGAPASLEDHFPRALASLWMAFQPVISWSRRSTVAYEAFMRTESPFLPNPSSMLDTAARLGRLQDLGRSCRELVAAKLPQSPCELVYVNIHAQDLLDEALYWPQAPLSSFASRTILEITGRELLDEIADLDARVAALRRLGYRLSLDDLGAGHAGLASLAHLEPDTVKFDISLVRDIHTSPVKRRLVRVMTSLFHEMDIAVVAEGVESVRERDTLVALGCDMFQGFLFARPGPGFPTADWSGSS